MNKNKNTAVTPETLSNFDVNGYLSNIIEKDKKKMHEKDKKNNKNSPDFYSESINDAVTNLDITV